MRSEISIELITHRSQMVKYGPYLITIQKQLLMNIFPEKLTKNGNAEQEKSMSYQYCCLEFLMKSFYFLFRIEKNSKGEQVGNMV